jgi:hypothetical protein
MERLGCIADEVASLELKSFEYDPAVFEVVATYEHEDYGSILWSVTQKDHTIQVWFEDYDHEVWLDEEASLAHATRVFQGLVDYLDHRATAVETPAEPRVEGER